ncbi:MAG: hypothetical protein ABGF52_10675, partial [Candidatus Asgardarchaeum sp.]
MEIFILTVLYYILRFFYVLVRYACIRVPQHAVVHKTLIHAITTLLTQILAIRVTKENVMDSKEFKPLLEIAKSSVKDPKRIKNVYLDGAY